MLERPSKAFSSSEHRYLGDIHVKGLPENFTKFRFPTGTELSFGEIIALSGDYFGLYLLPISLGASDAIKQERFMMAYQELKLCHPDKIYRVTNDITNDEVKQKFLIRDINGHVLMLAVHNIDHFGDYAMAAFEAGYDVAMQSAVKAASETDPAKRQEQLAYAYSLLAYACHFLTDRFASGHMRTPRMALDQMFSPELGALMTYFQHNEDGDRGLLVESASVESDEVKTWMAYGDGHLFENRNAEFRKRVMDAVQVVADELYQAFQDKQVKLCQNSAVHRLIPRVTPDNPPPLFMVKEDGKLYCRTPLTSTTSHRYELLTRGKAIQLALLKANRYIGSAIGDAIKKVLCCCCANKPDEGVLIDNSIFSKPNSSAEKATVLVRPNMLTF